MSINETPKCEAESIVEQKNCIVIQLNEAEHLELFFGRVWYESRECFPGFVMQGFNACPEENWDMPAECFTCLGEETSEELVKKVSERIELNTLTKFKIICALERSRIKMLCEELADEIEASPELGSC